MDIGILNSFVVVYSGTVQTISYNDQTKIPSWVFFKDTEILIGQNAKAKANVSPQQAIFYVKRMIDNSYSTLMMEFFSSFTIPYYNTAQRQTVRDASSIVGLNVSRLINQPTTAGMAYGLHMKEMEKNMLVYVCARWWLFRCQHLNY
ncbi:hypothetical protein FEM48_Zijuj02G0140900 [Ziziphus jujuba var. spinosa]|uniref:Uncharacterized protein n=1 Tax=Ziziphus jujuba var. spinosa TaxID=714518 RepID=A0A978VW46_ZIZJJ|nr:hypothetical protein FEM48_Zijuj02G0140900 [Ziziphus jujuba var. spinosa]